MPAIPDRHLDLGCGSAPRNPYGRRELCGVDILQLESTAHIEFRRANVVLEPIPFPDSHFGSVSAYDFIEHVPRVLPTADGRATCFPFVRLMDEIWRVLAPGGRLYSVTPAFPGPEAFQDPTHVNFITDKTWRYFCSDAPMARCYGYAGQFEMIRNEWAMFPEAFVPDSLLTWQRRFKRWRLERRQRLSHLIWEFECVKPSE